MRLVLPLTLFLLLFPAACLAQIAWPKRPLPDAVRLHVASWHDRGDFNDANLGLAVHWTGGFSAGGYYNSIRRASWYAGFLVPVYDRHSIRLEVLMGAITGYSDSTPAIPIAVPVFGYQLHPHQSIQLVFLPEFVLPANAVHAMYEVRFGS